MSYVGEGQLTLGGIDYLVDNIRGYAIIDMNNDDYTMTVDEAVANIKAVINASAGKALTIPTAADLLAPATSTYLTVFAGSSFTIAQESGGTTALISAPYSDQIYVVPGSSVTSEYNDLISNTAYSVAWEEDLRAPTKDTVYHTVESNKFIHNLLLMGG